MKKLTSFICNVLVIMILPIAMFLSVVLIAILTACDKNWMDKGEDK